MLREAVRMRRCRMVELMIQCGEASFVVRWKAEDAAASFVVFDGSAFVRWYSG